MAFVSITRLRVRSLRFMPGFLLHTLGTRRQVARAAGFQGGSLLADRARTFWTMTVWDDAASMRAYVGAGSHRVAMPRLLRWCDEASLVHWELPEAPPAAWPSWSDAAARMRRDGRPSKVLNPSPDHAALGFRAPRLAAAMPIRAVDRA